MNDNRVSTPHEVYALCNKVTNDVSNFLNKIETDLVDFKNDLIAEYEDEKKSEIHDLALIISQVTKYTEMKVQIKEASEKTIEMMFKSWYKAFEDLRNTLISQASIAIDEATLIPSDFTGPEYVSVVMNTNRKEKHARLSSHGEPPRLYPDLESLNSGPMKRKRVSSSSSPLGPVLQPKKPRKSIGGVFNKPLVVPETSSEEEEETEEVVTPPVKTKGGKNARKSVISMRKVKTPEISSEEEEASEQEVMISPAKKTRAQKNTRQSVITMPIAKSHESMTQQKKSIRSVFSTPLEISSEEEEETEQEVIISPVKTRARKSTRKSVITTPKVKSSEPSFAKTRTKKIVEEPISTNEDTFFKTQSKFGTSPANSSKIESDNAYSNLWNPGVWYQLNSLLGNIVTIPEMPAVYQIKVKQAKKSAYIGMCDNLRVAVKKYINGESSGKKHFDKFIERNINNAEIQCLLCSSSNVAKEKHKIQLEQFRQKFQKNPAYNM